MIIRVWNYDDECQYFETHLPLDQFKTQYKEAMHTYNETISHPLPNGFNYSKLMDEVLSKHGIKKFFIKHDYSICGSELEE